MSQYTQAFIASDSQRLYWHAVPRTAVSVTVGGSAATFTVPCAGAILLDTPPTAGQVVVVTLDSVGIDYKDFFVAPWNGLSKNQATVTTALLNHFDGTDGDTGPWTSVIGSAFANADGSTQLATHGSPAFGKRYLRLAPGRVRSNTAINIGTGDFAVELRFSVDSTAGAQALFTLGGVQLFLNTTNLYAYTASGGYVGTFSTVNATTLYYVAFSRTAGVSEAFVGTSGSASRIGFANDAGSYSGSFVDLGDTAFTGYIEELRVSVGGNRGLTGATVAIPAAAFSF